MDTHEKVGDWLFGAQRVGICGQYEGWARNEATKEQFHTRRLSGPGAKRRAFDEIREAVQRRLGAQP